MPALSALCPRPTASPDASGLLFRNKLVKRLLKLEKITQTSVEILDRFRHPGFSIFQGPPVHPDVIVAREKLAVYLAQPPVASERIDYQAGGVVFHPERPAALSSVDESAAMGLTSSAGRAN